MYIDKREPTRDERPLCCDDVVKVTRQRHAMTTNPDSAKLECMQLLHLALAARRPTTIEIISVHCRL